MTVKVTQYLRPDGRKEEMETDISDDCREAYTAIRLRGWRLAAEHLTTGEISLTVEDPKREVDVEIEVVPNGPEVPLVIERILNRAAGRVALSRSLEIDRANAEVLLNAAAELQRKFWYVMSELEDVLGVEGSATQDLEGLTIDDLLELAEPEEEERKLCTDVRCELPADHEGPCQAEAPTGRGSGHDPTADWDAICKDDKMEREAEDKTGGAE